MSDSSYQPAGAGDHFKVHTPDGLTLAAARHGSASGPEILLVHGLGQRILLGGFDGLGFGGDWLFGDWFDWFGWHGKKDIRPTEGAAAR